MPRSASASTAKSAKKTVSKKTATAKKSLKRAAARVKTVGKKATRPPVKKSPARKPAGLGKEIKTLAADTVKAASATAAFIGAAVKAAVPKVESAVGLKKVTGRR